MNVPPRSLRSLPPGGLVSRSGRPFPIDMLTIADIEAARERIRGGIYESPCVESIPLSQLTGAHIYCKLDYLQRTGSFKERGARNALLQLSPEQRQRGVIAASAGNHAQGVAYHGALLGIPVTVVMPKFASLIKVTNCRHLGATVLLQGGDLSEARVEAEAIAARDGSTFIHPYDNVQVMAGQGTIALEILEQAPGVQAIVAPVGGGGLLAGIGTVVEARKPDVRVVGVEPVNAACLTAALAAGHPVTVTLSSTLADGLAVSQAGAQPFEVLRRVVDQVVTVDEAAIALAVLRLIELEKSVVEGAGAAPLAAFLAGKLDTLKGMNVVLVLCGGNIDLTILDRVIEIGLVADGRLARFTVSISDRPGGLARLAEVIASTGASIKEIVHDRAFSGPDLSEVRVVCVVETTGHDHVKQLHRALADARVVIVPST
jgi:threonine dehydratase